MLNTFPPHETQEGFCLAKFGVFALYLKFPWLRAHEVRGEAELPGKHIEGKKVYAPGDAFLVLSGGKVDEGINQHGSYYAFLKIGVSIKETLA